VPEALTGAHAGWVLSREIEFKFQVPRLFPGPKAISAAPRWRGAGGPGAVYDEALSMRGSIMRENRETLSPPDVMVHAGRGGKSEDAIHRCTEQGV